MIKRLIFYGIYILISINISLLLSIVSANLIHKFRKENKAKLKMILKSKLEEYLAGINSFDYELTKLEVEVLEELILDHLTYVKGDIEVKLKSLALSSGIVEKELKELANGQWWNQARAAHKLGNLEAKEASPLLLDTLESKKKDLQFQSAKALIKINRLQNLAKVLRVLITNEEHSDDLIAHLVNEIQEDIYPVMLGFLNSSSKREVLIAIKALGEKKIYQLVPYLKQYLAFKEQNIVLNSLKVINNFGLGDNELFSLIAEKALDSSWAIRAEVAKILRNFITTESRLILKNLMKDRQWEVRFNAATSLLKQGDNGLLALAEMLDSQDKFATDIAWQFLQKEVLFGDLFNKLYSEKLYQKILGKINDYKLKKEE